MSTISIFPKDGDWEKVLNLTAESNPKYEIYDELGICGAFKDKSLVRVAGFKHRDGLYDTLYDWIKSGNLISAFAYGNSKDGDYKEENFSPIMLTDDIAYASCGNILDTKYLKTLREGNNFLFGKENLVELAKSSPKFIFTNSFKWMMEKIARCYVGMVFMRSDGEMNIIHENLLEDSKYKVKSFNFLRSKNAYLDKIAQKNYNTTNRGWPENKNKRFRQTIVE